MRKKKALIIGLVWPEPGSSAAGSRIIQLLGLLQESGYALTFASAAQKGPYSFSLSTLDIEEVPIRLNDSHFDNFLKRLDPQLVMFDRFVTEEQYGWRVSEQCPAALRILDTEDLHSLREARHQQVRQKTDSLHPYNDIAKREMASILRCDLSILISETEMSWIQQHFPIPSSLLYYIPFLPSLPVPSGESEKGYEDRRDLVFIGNYLHAPNLDAARYLKAHIWPSLSKKLPGVHLYLYGAYANHAVMQLHQPRERFWVAGRTPEVISTLGKYRLLLAPLRFGAGAKGKFIDAMCSGTPVVTTPVGAESMTGPANEWNGSICTDDASFIQETTRLYQNPADWENAQQKGYWLLQHKFNRTLFLDSFVQHLAGLHQRLEAHRTENFLGQMLSYHGLQSTKYKSLWIEEKNKTNPPSISSGTS